MCGNVDDLGAVHPHAGGEYPRREKVPEAQAGSPPRRWGIHAYVDRSHIILRFTPTQVGNTTPQISETSVLTVHPHAGGEYQANIS